VARQSVLETTYGTSDRPQLTALIRAAPSCAALVLMALIGMGISIYLTTVHYAHVPLYCSASGSVIDCSAVTTSSYSVVPGTNVPITVPGMLWFLVSGALALVAWREQVRVGAASARVLIAHALWGGIGMIFVLYLVYAELVKLHKICEWCTTVHVLTLLTFLVALYRLQQLPDTEQDLDDVGD
jgi:uncharacterized membrane protein